jgi:hypothetical protein
MVMFQTYLLRMVGMRAIGREENYGKSHDLQALMLGRAYGLSVNSPDEKPSSAA